MANEIELYGSNTALIEAKRNNYEIQGVMGGQTQLLKRDVDFGVIRGTKKPTLYKSGAEKVIRAFGLLTRFTVENAIEKCDDNPFFYYRVKCDLIKIHPVSGQEYVFATGFGTANSGEKRNGFNSAYDSSNSCIKMASKRAMVMAAITIGGISDAFEQDLENESFMAKADDLKNNEGENAPITAKQVKRIFALAAQAGYSTEDAKNKFVAAGFTSTKEITQAQYDFACSLFTKEEKK